MGAENFKYSKMPIVKLDKNIELTTELIDKILLFAQSQDLRYDSLKDYYTGNHDILYRSFSDTSKPNNKMVNNFASYIVDVKTGYFTGIPIIYNSKNQKYLQELEELFEYNNADDVTNELDRLTNIYGHGFELFWIDEEGEIRFKQVPPDELIIVYSADISEEILYAIRHYREQNIFNESVYDEYIFVYDKQYVYEYKYMSDESMSDKELVEYNMYPHMFAEVPVIEYVNNQDRLSSFEDVISLIDVYNVAESDSVNEVQYFNDAHLKLRNLSATDDNDISDMKNNRVILVEGDGDAEWLTKQINDINRLNVNFQKF
jgi:SPP1 family phage portal protein